MKKLILSLVALFNMGAELAMAYPGEYSDPVLQETIETLNKIEKDYNNDLDAVSKRSLEILSSSISSNEKEDAARGMANILVELTFENFRLVSALLEKDLERDSESIIAWRLRKFLRELKTVNNELFEEGYIFIPANASRTSEGAFRFNRYDPRNYRLGSIKKGTDTVYYNAPGWCLAPVNELGVAAVPVSFVCSIVGAAVFTAAVIPIAPTLWIEHAGIVLTSGKIVIKASTESEQFRINSTEGGEREFHDFYRNTPF